MRFKGFLTVVACAFFAFVCAGLRVAGVSKLADFEGDRTFYLQSRSSQALMQKTLSLADIPKVRGESVTIRKTLSETERAAFLEEVLEKYNADMLIEEPCGDTVSYYCYSAELGECVFVDGKAVNLHIAISQNRVALGTPLVFGGF